jgi:argininosuccinate synthase
MKRIVLAYSGGLVSSAAIPWLAAHADAEIVAVVMDVGRKTGLVEARERALALGAVRCHVVDVRDEFARDYVLPALRAGVFDEDRSWLPSALSRPLVARKLVEVARMEHASAIAYGSGRGYDRASLDALTAALDPSLERIAPERTWGMSPAELTAYARAHGISNAEAPGEPHEIAANLWGRSAGLDLAHDSWAEVPEDVYRLTRDAADAPDQPAYLDIEFERGNPTRVNGIEMLQLEMIESLETIAGAHGIGRADTIATRPDGTKYREISEAPAAAILHAAYRDLAALVLPPDLVALIARSGQTYSDLIQDGRWFSETREALDAFTRSVQAHVSGSIRLRLFKGDCRVAGRAARAAALNPTR